MKTRRTVPSAAGRGTSFLGNNTGIRSRWLIIISSVSILRPNNHRERNSGKISPKPIASVIFSGWPDEFQHRIEVYPTGTGAQMLQSIQRFAEVELSGLPTEFTPKK
jgi:hypothetical protein